MKINHITLLLAFSTTLPVYAEQTKVTDPHFQFAKGYLTESELPNSLELLLPPPDKDSRAFQRDEEARENAKKINGTERWKQAVVDAQLTFPLVAENFSGVMGFDITKKDTPHIYTLMQRVLTDAGMSTYGVKNKFNRTRPFVLHNEGTCTPDDEAVLRNDGSYPSGHTAAGWAWALVLTEVNPTKSNAILKKGVDFGDSRVICNAHWQSDVDAGRTMGAATVAVLHNNPAFLSDIAAAKKEAQQALEQNNTRKNNR